MSIGLFLDVDQTLTECFIQQHFARQLKCEEEYNAIERDFQAGVDPGVSDAFGRRIIELFAKHGFTKAKATRMAKNIPLRSWTPDILSLDVDKYFVSNGPSYFIEPFAEMHGMDPKKQTLCSKYSFDGPGGVISRCEAVSDPMKAAFVSRNAPDYDVTVGVGDSERHDGPFLNVCTIPIVIRRFGDQAQLPKDYPLINTLIPVMQIIEKLQASEKLGRPLRKGKPRIFIGSSRESQAVAGALHTVLNGYGLVDPHLWRNAFDAPDFTLEALEKEAEESDFAVFVCSPDDRTEKRGDMSFVPRDNILFELGLFMGRLGRRRCYMVTPSETKVELPSDLLGVTRLTYIERADGCHDDSVDGPAQRIGRIAEELGRRP